MSTSVLDIQVTLSKIQFVTRDTTDDNDAHLTVHLLQESSDDDRAEWRTVDRTEKLKLSKPFPSHLKFSKSMLVHYWFHKIHQHVRFAVYSSRTDTSTATANEEKILVGQSVTCQLHELIGTSGQVFSLQLFHEKQNVGHVALMTEQVPRLHDQIQICFSAKRLPSTDCFSDACDPYLTINKLTEKGDYEQVHKTEHIRRCTNPVWPPVAVSVMDLCDGDYSKPLQIQIHDWDPSGISPEFIAQVDIETTQTVVSQAQKTFELRNPYNTKSVSNSLLIVNNVQITKLDSFIDYVRGGFDLDLMFNIDFSPSNGIPNSTFSLHNSADDQNAYLQIIKSISNVVCHYNKSNEQSVQMFGFGTKLIDQQGENSYIFPMGGNFDESRIVLDNGVHSIINTYKNSLYSAKFETNLVLDYKCYAPVLKSCLDIVEKNRNPKKYAVIVIITNSDFSDTRQTLQQFVRASKLPVSIIVAAIEDQPSRTDKFEKLQNLLGDKTKHFVQDGHDKYAERDAVTFARLSLQQALRPDDATMRSLLSEVPKQFLEFQRLKNVKPADGHAKKTPPQKTTATVRLKRSA